MLRQFHFISSTTFHQKWKVSKMSDRLSPSKRTPAEGTKQTLVFSFKPCCRINRTANNHAGRWPHQSVRTAHGLLLDTMTEHTELRSIEANGVTHPERDRQSTPRRSHNFTTTTFQPFFTERHRLGGSVLGKFRGGFPPRYFIRSIRGSARPREVAAAWRADAPYGEVGESERSQTERE